MDLREVDSQNVERTISAEETLATAASIMAQCDVGILVVLSDGEVIGEISHRDINGRVLVAGRDPHAMHLRELLEVA